jgi:hypothetical protein
MIVNRTGTIEQRVTYVDNLGYAFCATCVKSIDRQVERDTARSDNAPCERCGKNLDQSREYVDVAYVVEAIVCKIF